MSVHSIHGVWTRSGIFCKLRQPIRVRWQSSFAHLESEMPLKYIAPVYDDMTPLNSYRLDASLADLLPGIKLPRVLPTTKQHHPAPVPHHLLHFEPALPASLLLPDGTNPAHSPGAPFHRRMWAGGTIRYSPSNPLLLDGSRAVCIESIRSATVRGKPGAEKVFVGIERRLAALTPSELTSLALASVQSDAAVLEAESTIRARLWRDSADDPGEASVLEHRNIVFLRDTVRTSASPASPGSSAPPPPSSAAAAKVLLPAHEPTLFRQQILPDAKLLFRFSALTFNAHAIHLDPSFCREKEGHRDLLFHGPLSLTLMLKMLTYALTGTSSVTPTPQFGGEQISFVEYRNLAPLYCNEPLWVCGWKDPDRPGRYEAWIEGPGGPEGGMKVRGKVHTTAADAA